ncbi:MAG: cytidylate kinase-like family protein [candidate division Zixibacteria bacterium]|jgi:cytidylate kinase|nr:cytidylate kinase-like family protein [candidate division Zixibacteria bacterium]
MSLITVSRGTYSGGHELSQKLADELGWQYVSREQLAEEAKRCGVPVDLLQEAIHKPPLLYEEMAQERLAYLACVRVQLCDKVLQGGVVYDGHAGHMLLSGVPNILRVRVVADTDFRTHVVMHTMGKSYREAKEYIAHVDLDRDRWSRFLYHVDWRDLFYYDVLVNISQTGINHALDKVKTMAGLPEFKFGDAARSSLLNLRLASLAHYRLLHDDRTRHLSVKIGAHAGILTVVGRPQDAEQMPAVRDVLESVPGVTDVRITLAAGVILFVQDRFKRADPSLQDVCTLADRSDNAVQLLRLAGPDATPGADFFDASTSHEEEVGIEVHDLIHPEPPDGAVIEAGDDLAECAAILCEKCRSAGVATFYGSADWLLSHLESSRVASMVVLGELFLNRSAAIRTRLRDQLARRFSYRLHVPVVTTEEISQKVRFSTLDTLRLAAVVLLSTAVVWLLLAHQQDLLRVLRTSDTMWFRPLAGLSVVVCTAGYAWLWGSAVKVILKLARFE